MRPTAVAIATLTTLSLIASACGSDDPDAVVDPTTTTAEPSGTDAPPATVDTTTVDSVPPTDVPDPDGGWIGGEPEWSATGGSLEMMEDAGAASDGTVPDAVDVAVELDRAPADFDASAPCVDCEFEPPPEPPVGEPIDDSPLRAGSVDDNTDFQGFLDYLDRIDGLGINTRDFDATGRMVVTVVGNDGSPIAGALVEATAGDVTVALRTTADGTARFLPANHDVAADAEVSFVATVGDTVSEPTTGVVGSDVAVSVPTDVEIASPVPLDVLFLLDATGSMGDEIDRLKITIDTVADRIASLDPAPDVRFAMTLYRDEGDAFLSRTFDFTGDVAAFQAALDDVVADGGGDYPEALDEGLASALTEPAWRDPSEAVQLVFVVADAPPQVARQVDMPYTDSIDVAIERGIKIFPVASSESDDQAEAVFRQMAQATGAPFVFLSAGAGGASTGENTDIDATDYEELALDDLVVRLVAEELADLTAGTDVVVTVPTTTPPPTTNPDGQ